MSSRTTFLRAGIVLFNGKHVFGKLVVFLLYFLLIGCDASDQIDDAHQSGSHENYPGSVHMDSSDITGWAQTCIDYKPGPNCDGKWQDSSKALGKAQGTSYDIVCLGDGGYITLGFAEAISDNEGYDFAVFENSFSEDFLELAFVEISIDGTEFIRFPAFSRTQAPISEYGTIMFTDVYNLDTHYTGFAGIHIQGYGTLFDISAIQELKGKKITCIRIRDIPGDGSILDNEGNPVFDPYPQKESAGFDLDGIAVISGK